MNKTIAKVGYALISSAPENPYTYATPVYFKSGEAGGRNVSAEPNGESNTIYADGLPVVVAEENAGYNISLELLSIIDDIETSLLGNIKTEDGSIIEKNSTDERPRFALIVAKERFRASTRYEIDIYLNCIISKRPSRADKTSEANFDPNFPTFEIAASPREDNKYVRVTLYADELPTTITLPTEASGVTENA